MDPNWITLGNNLHYIPFGAGRRICAGLPLGERMLIYACIGYVLAFVPVESTKTKLDSTEKLGIVLEKSTPLLAVPKPRLSSLEFYDELNC